MSFEDLPDELLVQILEYVPNASHLFNVSRQFNNIVNDIKCRVLLNPNKYIEELPPPVYFLLGDPKYHKSIWDKALLNGDLHLIIELNKLGYKFKVNDAMSSAALKGYKDLIDFFINLGADKGCTRRT